MKAGEKYGLASTQAVAKDLDVGNYTVKVTAIDWKTGEMYAQNQFGFAVELK